MQDQELRRPLGRAEVAELSRLLAGMPEAMRFPEAHGFLTAIALAPTTMMPSVWQPVMFGEAGFASMEQAQHVFGCLVMRLYNQIVTGLEDGRPLAPAGDESIGAWCAGFLEAARMDEVWNADDQATLFLFPFAVVAGEADLVGEEDADGKIIEDATPQIRRCRETLDATVHEANRYWTAWRRAHAAPIAQRSQKVGRNEPCPCGSGLKFKKCCALKAN